MIRLLILVIVGIGSINCGSTVGSYFEGRRVLHWSMLRDIRDGQFSRSCVFLKQTRGESRITMRKAKVQALDNAANIGANRVFVVKTNSSFQGSPLWDRSSGMSSHHTVFRHLYIVDAYYCARRQ